MLETEGAESLRADFHSYQLPNALHSFAVTQMLDYRFIRQTRYPPSPRWCDSVFEAEGIDAVLIDRDSSEFEDYPVAAASAEVLDKLLIAQILCSTSRHHAMLWEGASSGIESTVEAQFRAIG